MTELHHVLLHVRFLGFQIYIILGLILSAQLVWEECWVRFLTSGLTHKACAGIFVSPAQGTFQSCVSQPPLLDSLPAFSLLSVLREISLFAAPPKLKQIHTQVGSLSKDVIS